MSNACAYIFMYVLWAGRTAQDDLILALAFYSSLIPSCLATKGNANASIVSSYPAGPSGQLHTPLPL